MVRDNTVYFTKVIFYGIIVLFWLVEVQMYITRKVGDDECQETMS